MKRHLWIAALVLLPAGAAQSQEVVIDFDDLPALAFAVEELPDGSTNILFPDGTVFNIPAGIDLEAALPPGVTLEDLFPPPGEVPDAAPLPENVSPHATFSTEPGAGLYYFSGGNAVGSSPPNNITAAVNPDAFPFSSDLYVDFTAPVNNLSLAVSSDNDSGKIAEIAVHHFAGMTTLDVEGNGDTSDAIPIDLSGFTNVTRIEVINVTDTFGLSYDDFRFVPAIVIPEPSSMAILFVMLTMLSNGRRSRC